MSDSALRYFIINKPCNMVSQFVSSHPVGLLGDLDFTFPEGTHAIGRLDSNSGGLLILTTDRSITRRLFSSKVAHTRKYLVQVKRKITPEAIEKLRKGVSIKVEGGDFFTTTPCDVIAVDNPSQFLWPNAITNDYGDKSWVLITLTEGKFRQVRKMVAAVGHPCTRLIRIAIEDLFLESLMPGEVRELEAKEFFGLLKMEPRN